MTCFPQLRDCDLADFAMEGRRLLIAAEGFEQRSLEWIRRLPRQECFHVCLLCRYQPEREARLAELLAEAQPRCRTTPTTIDFHRFVPALFEQSLDRELVPLLVGLDEVVVDVSVMSKLMIVILIWYLRAFPGRVRLIYTEPMDYAPSREEYEAHKEQLNKPLRLPSYGVHEVVRTPRLSSVVMQRSPSVVVAFASLNEQLIRALLSTINPSHLIMINGVPPHLGWRETATQEIHEGIIEDYASDNPVDASTGKMVHRASTLLYEESFAILAKVYRDYCFSHRIVLAPTGSKMQAVAGGLFKACCPDVHVEYPTPESYLVADFSSSETRAVHEVVFDRFQAFVGQAETEYGLRG